uniref:FAS1 domain-containing protein n=1 Tax=Arundo donax TaxID=35708 RepID=A0A0A9H7N8_ARUDO
MRTCNTTFLMPNDRLMSTASIPKSQVVEFLSRHSISVPLMFDDLIRFPSGTVVPTHHSSEMITVTNSVHKKLYFNDIELTSPDLCHLGDPFRCHGINGVIRPTATRRKRGGNLPSLCCFNFCPTGETFSCKPILGHIFSTVSQHRFCLDSCPGTSSHGEVPIMSLPELSFF